MYGLCIEILNRVFVPIYHSNLLRYAFRIQSTRKSMYALKISQSYGGEVRVSHFPAPTPSRPVPPVNSSLIPALRPIEGSPLPPSLVRSLDSESGRPAGRSGFGLTPSPTVFGLPAQRAMRRSAKVLDDFAAAPEEILFFTGTLPGSTRASFLALSQYSGYMIHRLKSWAVAAAGKFEATYCWEWQKRGALHLHMAIYLPSSKGRRIIMAGMRDEWIRLLIAISDKSGVDLFARAGGRGSWRQHRHLVRARCEIVRKSVGAYLGKYLSKAATPGSQPGRYFYPSRWWGSTQGIKDILKRAEIQNTWLFSGYRAAANACEDITNLLSSFAEWSRSYRMKIVRGAVWVGFGINPATVTLFEKTLLPPKFVATTMKFPEIINRFDENLLAIASLRPIWFAETKAECPDVEGLWMDLTGEGEVSMSTECLYLKYFNCAVAIQQAVYQGRRSGREWLSSQHIHSLLSAAAPVVEAITEIWDELYLPIIETESHIRSKM